VPTRATLLKLVVVAIAAYALLVFAGVAGCDVDGSGTGDILRGESLRRE
jgi:hypothetical protein